MKRELMEHIGTTILNMLNGGHYGGGPPTSTWAAGEVWSKVYGPYFIYCNNVTNTLTGTNPAGHGALQCRRGLAHRAAGRPAPARGLTVGSPMPIMPRPPVAARSPGKFVINDSYNPNASAAGLWVGVIQQPITTTSDL